MTAEEFALEAFALELADTTKDVLTRFRTIHPQLVLVIDGVPHANLLSPDLAEMLNSPESQTLLFDTLAAEITALDPELAVWISECWTCEVAPEKVKHLSQQQLMMILAMGTGWLMENGFGRRSEAVDVLVQSRAHVVRAMFSFTRLPDRPITFSQPTVSHWAQAELPATVNAKLFREG